MWDDVQRADVRGVGDFPTQLAFPPASIIYTSFPLFILLRFSHRLFLLLVTLRFGRFIFPPRAAQLINDVDGPALFLLRAQQLLFYIIAGFRVVFDLPAHLRDVIVATLGDGVDRGGEFQKDDAQVAPDFIAQ